MLQPKRPNISNKSKKKLFQLQGETNLVQKDNIPNTKRDLSLMLAEYNNAKKDEQELRTTGQIKNPNSIQYKRNVRTQPNIKQDNISAEQRNAPLNPLQRPLIYLANPEKVLGDLGVPNMETSELDRQAINRNRFNPYQSRTDRFLNNAKIGLGYVPEATVNTALAAAFMPEGTGALGLVNETLNPLAGIKTSIPDELRQGLNSQGFLDMFKSRPKFSIKDDHFYRSIGADGVDDALSSGSIRSKQVGDYAGKNPYFVEGTDFDKLYSTGAGATSNKPEYIFEMPMVDKSGEAMTANRVNQSSGYTPYVADKNQIPLSEGSIYKLNSKGEYEVFSTPKPTSNFKSEINWGKWNKEIPNNPQLMKEYNSIEQTSKANGNWMKNTDGSTFNGTPEQFVQQNSENFKKAFGNSKLVNPDGSPTIQYHGSAKKFDTFDESKFQLGDAGYSGSGIYTTPNKTKASSYSLSSKSIHKDGNLEPTIYELYGQGNNPISAEDLINQKKEYDLFNFHRQKDWRGNVPLEEQMLDYDVAIRNQTRGIERVSPWNQADELVFPTNKQLKSAIGNNGMFDMDNPNIYKSIVPLAGASYLATQVQEEPKKFQQGGYINQNTNMNRYAQGGDLTQFNEGGLHSQNPLGGVPIGNNNSVEQGETKQDNFVYSNRIILDAPTVSQYNLPKSLVGKSVADATKLIDNKFKGRNDKISQSTKNSMLSKIAEAQESMKPQEPETEQSYSQEEGNPSQMAYGGDIDIMKGQQLGDTFVNTAATGADMIAPGTGQILKAGDQLGQSIGESIGGDRGESIGGLINPMGTLRGLGSAVKTGNLNDIPGIGIFGGKTSRQKAAIENTNNFVSKQYNNKYNTQWGDGGVLPYEKITTQQLQNTTIVPNTSPNVQTDRFRYAVGEQGGVQHGPLGEQGHYLYYGKKPGDAGFNPAIHREFVNQNGYDTYMRSPQGQQYRRNLSTQSLQPIEQLANGGKMKKMGDGGYYDKNRPYFMTNPGLINSTNVNMGPVSNPDNINEIFKVKQNLYPQSIQNLKPDNSVTDSSVLKQYNNDLLNPGLYNTQKVLDGDRYSFENRLKRFGTAVNDNAGNLARYAPIAANALQLAQLKKPQGERLDRLSNRYKPEYVDEAQLQNIANQTMNNTVNAISQSGASQGQTRASILGSQLERTKALSDAYSQAAAQNRQQNAMAQEFNLGVDQVNLQQSNSEKDINARNKGAYDTEKSKLIGKIGENIGNVGTEQAYKKIAVTTTGYNWLGEFQKMNPNATKEETVIAAKKAGVTIDDDKTVKKQALGGYLIKNKVK